MVQKQQARAMERAPGVTLEVQGESGVTYAFYTVATDHVGNVEAAPATTDAATTITSEFIDLLGAGFSAPTLLSIASLAAGPVQVQVSIANQGTIVAPNFTVSLVRSANATIGDGDDTPLSQPTLPGVNSGTTGQSMLSAARPPRRTDEVRYNIHQPTGRF